MRRRTLRSTGYIVHLNSFSAILPPTPDLPLLLLDYDGTLAPIVDDPAAAVPHPDVAELLRRLADLYPVVVVTGRDIAGLARVLVDVDGAPVPVSAIGLHGAEEGDIGKAARRSSFAAHEQALNDLRAAVPPGEGITIESKGGAAFAVHYRLAPDADDARATLAEWAAGAPEELEAIWGNHVVEFRPQGVSKGVAAARLALEHPAHTPVYVGDDVTDEDAFLALNEIRPDAVTIRVGTGDTAARYRLDDVSAVVRYLRTYHT